MVSHKEFVGAGKEPGLQVWRIENMDLKPVPKALHGNFYTGDAYLLLFTTAAPSYNIHMWLGKTWTHSTVSESLAVEIFLFITLHIKKMLSSLFSKQEECCISFFKTNNTCGNSGYFTAACSLNAIAGFFLVILWVVVLFRQLSFYGSATTFYFSLWLCDVLRFLFSF